MDDLISRTEFLKGFSYHAPEERFSPDEVVYLLTKAPTVAAEPVRRGRWMIHHYDREKYEYTEIPYNPKGFNSWDGNMYCSICRGDALCNGREEQVPSSRCPSCGAHMDLDHLGDATAMVEKEDSR
jgi:hypothetical protein